ncbi:MAG TPA: tetratricopeptide repeat protein, partial [Planctomycetota bacterium]|nr:tetratricopeptide repeat protein [Planctomycetota bacterium]
MSGILSRFSKEQWLCIGSVVTSLVLLLLFMTGGSAGGSDTTPTSARERTVAFPVVTERAALRPRPEDYEGGKNIFAPPGKTRLPLPELPLPEPDIESAALPPFAPAPDLRTLFLESKWPGLFADAAKPAIPAAQVDLAQWQAVSALTLPVAAPPKDKRNDFVPGREFDEVRVLDETNRVIRGRIPRADPTKPQDPIVLIIDEQNRPQRFPRDKVAISFSQTFLQKYLEDAKTVGDVIRDRVRFAKMVFEWGMIPEAKAEFEIILQRKQDEWESLDRLIELYLADLEFEKAVELLDAVVRRVDGKDKQSKARFRLGGIWERLGLLDKALFEYDQAFPSVIEAGILRGRVLYKKGELKEAFEALSEALRMPVPAEQMAPLGYALRGLTRLQLNAGPEGLTAALTDLDESLRRLPTEPGALNGRGVVRAIQGDSKRAMEDFAASLKNDQFHAPAWINMTILLVARGSLDEAEACIAAALQRCPGAHELQALRGVIKLARGKSEEAKADFDASHLIRKDNFYAHYGQGIVHLRGGRFPEAKQSLVEAVKREFYFSPSYYNAAVANIKAGDLATAEALLREIIRQRPGYRDPIVALTLLLLRQGRIAESLLAFQEIVDKIAGNGNLLYVNGFITFHGDDPNVERRVQQTRDHLLDAAAAGSAHAPGVVRQLNEWLATYVLFNEGFARGDSPKVGAG